jgi:hypothetical protein
MLVALEKFLAEHQRMISPNKTIQHHLQHNLTTANQDTGELGLYIHLPKTYVLAVAGLIARAQLYHEFSLSS